VPAPLPLFTTLLNYRHSGDAAGAATAGMEGIRLLSVHEAVNYPLAVAVDDHGHDFALKLHGVRALNLKRIHRYLLASLNALVLALETAAQEPLAAMDIRRKSVSNCSSISTPPRPAIRGTDAFTRCSRSRPPRIPTRSP
jgi:hypothetical protein